MANTVQLTQDGNIVYPITDVSCVMGLDEGAITEAVLCWDGASTPVVANIPAGVVVTYNSTTYTGTLAASADTVGKIYMVATGTSNNYNRYMTFAGSPSYVWQNIGDTTIDLSSYATKAEVTELEAKVDELESTSFYGVFVNGSLSNGVLQPTIRRRISSEEILSYDREISITAQSGFRFGLHYFENGVFVGDSGWLYSSKIQKGVTFKVVIARVTESTSEVANIDEFLSGVYVTNIIDFVNTKVAIVEGEVAIVEGKFEPLYSSLGMSEQNKEKPTRNGSKNNSSNAYAVVWLDIPCAGYKKIRFRINKPFAVSGNIFAFCYTLPDGTFRDNLTEDIQYGFYQDTQDKWLELSCDGLQTITIQAYETSLPSSYPSTFSPLRKEDFLLGQGLQYYFCEQTVNAIFDDVSSLISNDGYVSFRNGTIANTSNANCVTTAVIATKGAKYIEIRNNRPNKPGYHYIYGWMLTSAVSDIGEFKNVNNASGHIMHKDASDANQSPIIDISAYPNAVGIAITIGEYDGETNNALRIQDFDNTTVSVVPSFGVSAIVGGLDSLSTTNKSDIVHAINEVDSNNKSLLDVTNKYNLFRIIEGKGQTFSDGYVYGLQPGRKYVFNLSKITWDITGVERGNYFAISNWYNGGYTALVEVANQFPQTNEIPFTVPQNSDFIAIGGRAAVGEKITGYITEAPEGEDAEKMLVHKKMVSTHYGNQGLTIIGDTIVQFNSGVDDHSSYSAVRRWSKDDFTFIDGMTHNLGHAATIDYDSVIDALVVGNGTSDTSVAPRLDIVLGASAKFADGSPLNFNNPDILHIELKTTQKEIGGSGLICCFGGNWREVFLATGQNAPRKIFRCLLGVGEEDFSDNTVEQNDVTSWGTFIPGKTNTEYNGTLKVLSTYTGEETQVYQGMCYRAGFIYLACGYSQPLVHKIRLYTNGRYGIVQTNIPQDYNADGSLKSVEPEGLCFYDGTKMLIALPSYGGLFQIDAF